MYNPTQKQKILNYLKKHTQAETCRVFDIRPDTLKYWQNNEYKEKTQQKQRSKYSKEDKRKYEKGNAEAQRISAQIKRAIKRVPAISYSKEEIEQELLSIQQRIGSLQGISNSNKTILTYQQHFYEKERQLFADVKIARKIIKNRAKYLFKEPKYLTDQEILRGFKISGEYYGFSHFAPEWFKWFAETTKATSILDPCGGWGHRLLGTINSGIKTYIYNDFDARTHQGCANIYTDWSEYFDSQILLHNQRAEHLDVSNMEYDSIFTCPPYFNKETYNDKTFKDFEDFSNWWRSVINNILKSSVNHIGIVIDPENNDCISEPILQQGYKLDGSFPIKVKKSHFTTGTVKDNVLIYSKL